MKDKELGFSNENLEILALNEKFKSRRLILNFFDKDTDGSTVVVDDKNTYYSLSKNDGKLSVKVANKEYVFERYGDDKLLTNLKQYNKNVVTEKELNWYINRDINERLSSCKRLFLVEEMTKVSMAVANCFEIKKNIIVEKIDDVDLILKSNDTDTKYPYLLSTSNGKESSEYCIESNGYMVKRCVDNDSAISNYEMVAVTDYPRVINYLKQITELQKSRSK